MLPGVLVESDVPLEGDVVYETEEREEEVLTCIKENINSTLTQAKIIKEKIDDFKDDYTQDKFQTSWTEFDNIIPRDRDGDILEVCSVEQTCSTVLPSLPAISVSPPTTDTEVVRMLDERFGEILRFLSAFEQMVIEQALREDIFAKQMFDAYTNHKVLARCLEEVQEKCGLQSNTSVLEPLHGKMYVETSEVKAHIRGFSTLRQSLQGLQLLLDMFQEERANIRRVNEDEEEAQDEEERKDRRKSRRKNGRNDSRKKKNRKNKKGNKRTKRRKNYLD